MKLLEYQAQEILARYGIPFPRSQVASTPQEVYRIAHRLGRPVVVKAQVSVGGRGKAGGIRLAPDPQKAKEVAQAILGMEIKGLVVDRVLVAEAAHIQAELYLGLVVDRAARALAMMASSEGGVEIEEVARAAPEKIAKAALDPFLGLQGYQARQLASEIGLSKDLVKEWAAMTQGLYQAFLACDASLAEINPMAVTKEGKLVALDAKMVLDDNALFRHPELEALRGAQEDPYERQAWEAGLSYVRMEGDIGCLVNGAGLAMATMDVLKLYGGEPANFLDVGGGASAERVAAALRLILADQRVKAVLINIFGGITRCDEVALGILEALQGVELKIPLVVRLAGTNEEEGRRLLAQMETAATLVEAAQRAVEAAGRR